MSPLRNNNLLIYFFPLQWINEVDEDLLRKLRFLRNKWLNAHGPAQVLTAAAVGHQPATSNSLNELWQGVASPLPSSSSVFCLPGTLIGSMQSNVTNWMILWPELEAADQSLLLSPAPHRDQLHSSGTVPHDQGPNQSPITSTSKVKRCRGPWTDLGEWCWYRDSEWSPVI